MKVGLALSGGGISGMASVGVLMALEEAGIPIDFIAGTSSGAVVAALYACGYRAEEIIRLFPKVSWRQLDWDYKAILHVLFRSKRRSASGFVQGETLARLISEATNHRTLSETQKPIAITATDLTHNQEVLFVSQPFYVPHPNILVINDQNISLSQAVRASISIPGFFTPVIWKDRQLVDGGLLDNCPILPVRSMGADKVLAVDVIAPYAERRSPAHLSINDIGGRIINLMLARQSKVYWPLADLVLTPDVGSVGVLAFRQIEACVEKGYLYTRKRLAEVKKVLET